MVINKFIILPFFQHSPLPLTQIQLLPDYSPCYHHCFFTIYFHSVTSVILLKCRSNPDISVFITLFYSFIFLMAQKVLSLISSLDIFNLVHRNYNLILDLRSTLSGLLTTTCILQTAILSDTALLSSSAWNALFWKSESL